MASEDDEHPRLGSQPHAMTMQFDALQDEAEFLDDGGSDEDDSEYVDGEAEPAPPSGSLAAPPPLPPRSSLASQPSMPVAPTPRRMSPVTWIAIGVVALAMAGLGIWVGNLLTEEEPEPQLDIQLGDIEVTPH